MLVRDKFEYDGPLDLTEYHVTSTEITSQYNGFVRVEVKGKLIGGL